MSQVETGNAASDADGLDGLRADLARLILNEAGQAVARDPGLPLSAALVQAVDRRTAQAARDIESRTPSVEALADAVLDAVGPELIRIARAAGAGETASLGGRSSRMTVLIGAGIAVLAAILLFVGGFVTARLLPDRATTAPTATAPSPAIVDPAAVPGQTPQAQANRVQPAPVSGPTP